MPNDTFVMSARQSAELDHAFERHGWTPADVKWLSSGDTLAEVLQVRRGNAEIKYRDSFRETGEFTFQIPALKRPTLEELQKEDPWIASIERDTSPEGPVTLKLVTVLRSGEDSIGGEKYEQRLAPVTNDALGYQQRNWLIDNQDKVPARVRGKFYIDFPGIIVVNRDGYRHIPFAHGSGVCWYRHWGWLGSRFYSGGRIALSSK